jgi:Reverse transcriptase (RNA-dependent DNA polymerase)
MSPDVWQELNTRLDYSR